MEPSETHVYVRRGDYGKNVCLNKPLLEFCFASTTCLWQLHAYVKHVYLWIICIFATNQLKKLIYITQNSPFIIASYKTQSGIFRITLIFMIYLDGVHVGCT